MINQKNTFMESRFEVNEPKPIDTQFKNNDITIKEEYSVKNEIENTYGVNRKNGGLNNIKEIDYFNNCIFETEIEIIRHKLFEPELMSEDEDLTPSFDCNYCQKSLKSKRQIKNHIFSVHSLGNDINCKHEDTMEKRSKANAYKIRSFDCNVCRKRLATKSNIIRHLANSHSSCISMGNHPLPKSTKPYKCSVSDKFLRVQNSLRCVHADENPNKCHVCGKSFSSKSNLKIHERLHTGQKQYKCYVCGKSFTQSYDLTKHEVTHTGKKPYKCYICEKSFGRQSSLKRHKQIHTGGKRYKCNVCEKSFSHPYSLKMHQAKAHN